MSSEAFIAEAAPFCVGFPACKPYPPGVLPYGLWRVSCISRTAGRIVAEVPIVGITVVTHNSGTSAVRLLWNNGRHLSLPGLYFHLKPQLGAEHVRQYV